MLHPDLKTEIQKALAGSTSQQPVDTAALYHLGTQKRVKAALMEMYQARELCCCMITRGGTVSVMWWLAGNQSAPAQFGKAKAV